MATAILYQITRLQNTNDKTLFFSSSDDRDSYFSSVTKKLTLSTSIGWLKNPNGLYNEITLMFSAQSISYNYIQIINDDSTKKLYFYIIDAKELGNSQTSYTLKLDTFMTYMSISNAGIYIGGTPSLVLREHKPRFNFTTGSALFHDFPEPFNPSLKINTTTVIGNDSSRPRTRFLFRNRFSDWKPVAYVFTETATTVTTTDAPITMTLSAQSGTPRNAYVWDGNYTYTTIDGGTPSVFVSDNWALYFHTLNTTVGGNLQVSRMLKSTGVAHSVVFNLPAATNLRIQVGSTSTNELYNVLYQSASYIGWTDIQANYGVLNNIVAGSRTTSTFNNIDIYEAKNERVVEIPYLDNTMTFKQDSFGIYVELDQINKIEFNHTFTKSFNTSKSNINRVSMNDPKLFTSQFAPIIIQNYTGQYVIKREKLQSLFGGSNFTTTFKLTSPIIEASTMNMIVNSTNEVNSINENNLSYAINNEIATVKDEAYTYNQYYRDIDERSQRISENQQFRNASLGTLSQITGVVGGAMSFASKENGLAGINKAQLTARGIGAAVSIYETWQNYNDLLETNKLQREKQLTQILLSQSQIAGSSLEFQKTFNNDKVRSFEFSIVDTEKNYYDLTFHKYGYSTLEYKIPTLKTRKYWDFKQIILNELEIPFNLSDEVVNDLKLRFANGITIYHPQDDNSVDWNQEKENWEL